MKRTAPRHELAGEGRTPRAIGSVDPGERLKASALDALSDAVLISDGEARIVEMNPAAERLFGLAKDDARGTSLTDLITGAPDLLAHAEEDGLRPHDRPIVAKVRRGNGETFPAAFAIRRFCRGERAYLVAQARDLMAERSTAAALQAERETREAAERTAAMTTLLAGVAHELNNPLAVLLAQSTLLREKAPTPDVEGRAAKIEAAARRAGRIVKSFLALARRKTPVLAPLGLEDVIDDALGLMEHGLGAAQITVERTRARGLPALNGDRDLLEQMFTHLLMDAQASVLARQEGRRIVIHTSLDEERVVFSIEDNGASPTPESAGTGVGLALCRSVVDAHAGNLALDGSPEGGRRVRVSLSSRRSDTEIATSRSVSPGLSILVVDDEIEVAQSLAELIEIFGHRVFVETSSQAAMTRMGQQSFDGVFTDLRMPGLDGLQLRQAIASRDPALAARTVIVTGDSMSMAMSADQLTLSPDTLSLEKPFTAGDVKAALKRIAAR